MSRIVTAWCAACLCFAASASEDSAREILETAGIQGGLVVHVGCADGRLTAALGASERFVVHGLDTDAGNVAKARAHIQSLGLYGRISADRLRGEALPYADNLASLVVLEDVGAVPMAEVMRVLRPLGTAYVKQDGAWEETVKPWPEGMDEWTHWLHNPTGNAVARDRLVGPPRRLQWMAAPVWSRHHDTVPSVTAMVSARGRIFYIADEAPAGVDGSVPDKWFLTARDAFNGVLLWKLPMPEWGWRQWNTDWRGRFNMPPQLPKRLVAVGDTVYATLGFNAPLTALDAATGRTLRTYEGTQGADEILYVDGLLVLAVNQTTHTPSREDKTPVRKDVCVLDADTGKTLWRKAGFQGLAAKADSAEPFGRLEMVVGDGQVFLADHDALVSLDLNSGEELWRAARPEEPEFVALFNMRMNDLCVLLYDSGVALFAQPEMEIKDPHHSIPGSLYAFSAKTGEPMWKQRYAGWAHFLQPDVFVIDGTVWIHEHQEAQEGRPDDKHYIENEDQLDFSVLGLDLKTGEIKRRFSTRETFVVGHHHRCYRNKATERYLLTSRRGVEFLDLKSEENQLHHWVRGGCLLGIMPCNGLLYATPHPCDCYIATKLNGLCALAPEERRAKAEGRRAKGERLVKGPAHSEISNLKSKTYNSNDWPTYRHDPGRSGSTSCGVPAVLERLWRTELGGRLTPLTAADGMIFAALADEHQVVALDAARGKPVWTFTAGARVDSPPTIHEGLALFGSADGWAYCLRASDGELVWRRRIAPQARLIGAFGQLESAWPVHGSVLVKDGVAYLSAGRSSYVDDGIFLCGLDPKTGEILEEKTLYSPDPETDEMPPGTAFEIPGALSDILVAQDDAVYMRQMKVFGPEKETEPWVMSTAGFLDESWFNRTRWLVGARAAGQLLVRDDRYAYGVQAYPNIGRNKFFSPGGEGYLLFSSDLNPATPRKPSEASKKSKGRGAPKHRWSVRAPVRMAAMFLAPETLFIAGAPDVVESDDPLGAYEGRKGALLWAVSADDGKTLSEHKIASPPVFDGMIAADERIYLAMKDGTIGCWGARR